MIISFGQTIAVQTIPPAQGNVIGQDIHYSTVTAKTGIKYLPKEEWINKRYNCRHKRKSIVVKINDLDQCYSKCIV